MSEGWLTESALLPTQPKPISGVTGRSLRSLQSLVSEQGGAAAEYLSVEQVAARELTKRQAKRHREKERRDNDKTEIAQEETQRADKLARKVQLYEALKKGDLSPGDAAKQLTGNTAEEKKVTTEDLLVDFDEQIRRNEINRSVAVKAEEGSSAKASVLSRIELLRQKQKLNGL